ncbi:hypothetical protein [Paraburkholderia sp.]|uniref:hypothetical protein n=1 Tax=Paraburkholderia sp. TaxID=1926495 RepID=UPI002D7FCA4F|nr:hypothetical protein [Paraburkholderia sp.]
MGELAKWSSRIARPSARAFVSLAAACSVLAGCASAGQVTAADKQGAFVVSASATGGRLAWARAHKRALTEATDYCERRGMRVSLSAEQMDGIEALQQHDTVIRFECNPKL